MGFFDFFKKPKEKEILQETVSLSLSEIEPFLNKKSEETSDQISRQINQIKTEISQEAVLLKNNLSALEIAEVKNKEIPERARHIMEGNRQIYLSKTRALIEKLSIPENPQEILTFIEKFDKELDSFDKTISKSHRVLEEFCLDKASVIATSIKKIDKVFRDLKKTIESSGLTNMEEMKKKVFSINEKIKQSGENKLKMKEEEETLRTFENEINQKQIQLNNIQKQDTYKKAISLVNSRLDLEKELQQSISKFRYSFSEIEAALKKYENLSQNKLAKKYLEDPVSAIQEDKELEILKILDATQKAIIKQEITLKDTKKDRIMNELFNLNENFFKNFLEKRAELSNLIAEKNSQTQNSQILKDIADLEKSIDQDKTALKEKISSLEKMKKSSKDIDLPVLKTELENDFKTKLNLGVKIN